MSENTVAPINPTDPPSPPVPTIKELVAENLANSGPQVKDVIVEELTAQEIEKRAELVRKALPLIEQAQGELNKVNRPDVVVYDAEGKEKDKSFSKNQIDTRKKAQEKVEKLNSALTEALTNSNFEPLKKAVGGGGDKQEASSKE